MGPSPGSCYLLFCDCPLWVINHGRARAVLLQLCAPTQRFQLWLWCVITQVGEGTGASLYPAPGVVSHGFVLPSLGCTVVAVWPPPGGRGIDLQSTEPSRYYLQLYPPGDQSWKSDPAFPEPPATAPRTTPGPKTLLYPGVPGLCYCWPPQYTHTHMRPRPLAWVPEMQTLVPKEMGTGLHLRHQHHHHKKYIPVPGPRCYGNWSHNHSSTSVRRDSTPDLGPRRITSNKISSPRE